MERDSSLRRESVLEGDRIASKIESEPQLSFLPEVQRRFPDAEWYLVGGAIRDIAVGREGKDYDFLVRQVDLTELSSVLQKMGRVDLVGRNFGVLKFRPQGFEEQEEVDIAWPRTERAGMSGGYRDFEIQSDPNLPVERDLERRDFTMNAIAWDVGGGRLVDPFGGQADIEGGLVRAVGQPEARFREDYSRMLRAIRQACQLGFEIEPGTWEAIQRLVAHLDDQKEIVETDRSGRERSHRERVVPWETVAKELLKSFRADPQRALNLLESSGALRRLVPEVAPLDGCAQSPEWHSEGDVWTHTKLTVAAFESPEFRKTFSGQPPDIETVLAAVLHDAGKPEAQVIEADGRITFHGHAEASARLAEAAIRRLKLTSAPGGFDAQRATWLIKNHMLPLSLNLDTVKQSTLYKYFLADPAAGRGLLQLSWADALASRRPNGKPDLTDLKRLAAALEKLGQQVGGPKPPKLVSGRDVMEIAGLEAGPEVGRILAEIQEAQLQGQISDSTGAKELIRRLTDDQK